VETGNQPVEPRTGLPEPAGEDELQFWKKYLVEHPDSKMAWYLLGKAYDRQQQPGKANYCYVQAGDVYRAYEKKSIAMDAESEQVEVVQLDQRVEPTGRSGKSRRTVVSVIVFVVLLSFLAASAVRDASFPGETDPPGIEDAQQPTDEDEQSGADETPVWIDPSDDVEKELPTPPVVRQTGWSVQYMDSDRSQDEQFRADAAAAVGGMLVHSDNSSQENYLVHAGSIAAGNRQWIEWRNGMNVLVAIDKPARSGVSRVHHYDEWLCECSPTATPARITEAVLDWQAAQEELLVAMSAAEHYRQRNGGTLENPQQLTADYPRNALSGLTALMADELDQSQPVRMDDTPQLSYFPYKALLQFPTMTDEPSDPDGLPDVSLVTGTQGVEDDEAGLIWDQPLEIIVDTSTHKLAVVSGSVMLRNYSVGLGGERTPHGEFTISEKVRNPNGRDDGDFGSRGMTLSDTLYAIHGTNEPESIGKDESLGCVRMTKEDVEELFDMVPLGTKVTITDNVLPDHEIVPVERFGLPSEAQETNDAKVYKWL